MKPKRLILPFILLIASVSSNSQGIFLPSSVVDSIIWKLKVGVICDSLQVAQRDHITKLQTELLTQGKIINLQKQEATQMDEIIKAMQQQFSATKVITDEKILKLKQRLRKVMVILVGESGLIVVMVILLL